MEMLIIQQNFNCPNHVEKLLCIMRLTLLMLLMLSEFHVNMHVDFIHADHLESLTPLLANAPIILVSQFAKIRRGLERMHVRGSNGDLQVMAYEHDRSYKELSMANSSGMKLSLTQSLDKLLKNV
ncbi:hypothetical protein BdWA1_003143 [Babesia duncani]|uniref:Uncharacterized protein n=1 Tax=Babesia duncani TaxID=323732 RepID=A0AAD9PJ73_9APIC|nr:hypothetical protein BdWA1_003143 [Babesia duncani]